MGYCSWGRNAATAEATAPFGTADRIRTRMYNSCARKSNVRWCRDIFRTVGGERSLVLILGNDGGEFAPSTERRHARS